MSEEKIALEVDDMEKAVQRVQEKYGITWAIDPIYGIEGVDIMNSDRKSYLVLANIQERTCDLLNKKGLSDKLRRKINRLNNWTNNVFGSA